MKIWKYTFCTCTCNAVSQCSILPSTFLLQLASVEQHCELDEKSELVQQANVFKRQTLAFHFSTYRPNSCKHLSHHLPVWPHEGIDRGDRCIGCRNNTATRFFLINNTFLTMSKSLHQTCISGLVKYLSPYTGRISDWMAFCTKSFCPQQTNNRRLFLVRWFQRQRCHI